MSGEGNLSSSRSFVQSLEGTNRAIVGGLVNPSGPLTSISTGLKSIDYISVTIAGNFTANVDGISATVNGSSISVREWNGTEAPLFGFLPFYWMAVGEL